MLPTIITGVNNDRIIEHLHLFELLNQSGHLGIDGHTLRRKASCEGLVEFRGARSLEVEFIAPRIFLDDLGQLFVSSFDPVIRDGHFRLLEERLIWNVHVLISVILDRIKADRENKRLICWLRFEEADHGVPFFKGALRARSAF